MKNQEKKIIHLKAKILETEDDLLKLRARKAALERERDMESFSHFKEVHQNGEKCHKNNGLHR